MSMSRRFGVKLLVCAAVPISVMGLTATAASAAPTCDSADFTVDGDFDLDGYLACLAGSPASGGGGALPTTGSDVTRMLAIGAGLLAVGGGAVAAAKRDRKPSLEAA